MCVCVCLRVCVYTCVRVCVRVHRGHRRRVFQTVKNINQTVRQRSPIPGSNANIPGSNQTQSSRSSPLSSGPATPRLCPGDITGEGVGLDNRAQSILMEAASNRER